MAQVDFYVLERVDEHARDTLACKLAEKAWRLENTIHIHAMTREDAERLDKLLKRHPVLEPLGDRDGEASQDPSQSGTLLG